MLCFLYVIALTGSLGLIATLIEPVLAPRAPRRWLWCAAIALAMTVPGFYQAKHNVPIHGKWAAITSHDALLVALWSKATLGLLLWGVLSVLLVAYAVHRARVQRVGPNVVDGVRVVVTEKLGPATAGFWRARVLLPRWVLAMPSVQRQYILRHEEEHRKAHDGRVLFIASLALVVVPWNVAMWWLLRRLALAIEMDCDNRVVSALGHPRRYGELLLRVAQTGSRGPRLQPGFIGGIGTLERRLRALVAPAALSRALRYLLLFTAIALLLAVLAVPHPVLGAH
ncbi:MAG TPA: M56 family metallopeptidase [Longimicrobiales bacterium]|nr:M56 family metallopeptidase [Longimicrobiales bacterium]